MQAILSSLTAAALLAHAIVGCYGHHALACFECEQVEVTLSCCDHDHGSPAENHSPELPCDCVLTCVGSCVTLPPQKTHLDVAALDVSLDMVAAEPVIAGNLVALAANCDCEPWYVAHQPPVGLHLLHQSLLI